MVHHVLEIDDCIYVRPLACTCIQKSPCIECYSPTKWDVCEHQEPEATEIIIKNVNEQIVHDTSEFLLPTFPRPVINAADFVLLRFQPSSKNSTSVYYVGKVLRKVSDEWEIKCMRRKGNSGATFRFPQTDDVAAYKNSDVVILLMAPRIVRGIHYFLDNLSMYNLR
jgi:hypothetical protein